MHNNKQFYSSRYILLSGTCRGGTMALVHYLKKPELRNPVVVAAFAGWNDAADAATTAVKFLIDRWKPLKFAEIEAEEFYVSTETRPTISIKKGVSRAISW